MPPPPPTRDNSNTDSINFVINWHQSSIECLLSAQVAYMLVCGIHKLKNTQNFSTVGIFSLFNLWKEYVDLCTFSEVLLPSVLNGI